MSRRLRILFTPAVWVMVLSAGMTLTVLLNPIRRAHYAYENPDSVFVTHGDVLRNTLYNMHPDSAWLLLVVAAIFLYLAVRPSRPPAREL